MSLFDIIIKVLSGMGATFLVFFATIIISIPLGLLMCIAKMSKIKILKATISFIISILRGTPLMLQLIVWFFGPYYIFGMRLNNSWRIGAVILGFSINYAAYFAEIFRSGIQTIDIGQYEACQVLGYNKLQVFFKITLPQMIKNVIPALSNEIITLVKDTSLAFVITYTEVFTLAKQVAAKESNVFPLFIAGGFYYIFNLVVVFICNKIEKHFNYYN